MPPALMKKTVGKMGLRGQRGLRGQGRAGVPMAETLQPGERFRTPVEAEAAEAVQVRESVRCPRVVAGSNTTTTTTTTTSIKRKICRFFSTDDGCRFGEKCKFLHATSEGEEENKNYDKSSSGGSFEKNNNDKNHRRRRQRRRRRGGSGTLNQSNTASK